MGSTVSLADGNILSPPLTTSDYPKLVGAGSLACMDSKTAIFPSIGTASIVAVNIDLGYSVNATNYTMALS